MSENGLEVKALPRRVIPNLGAAVYDRQTQEKRVCTPERRALMHETHRKIMQANFDKSLALHMINQMGLYTEWGYETFGNYVEGEWDFGLRQAYRYAQIGKSIQMMINAAESEGGESDQNVAGLLSGINTGQWQQLLLLNESELKKLATTDEYVGPDGNVFTLAQLADMSTKELKDQVRKLREKTQIADGKMSLLESEIVELKAQIGDDPTAAGEMMVRLKTLQAEIDVLRGAARKREQAVADVNEASKKIEEGLAVLRKYEPHGEKDFDDAVLSEVMAEVAGRCAGLAKKFEDITSRYVREHGKWSGQRQ